MISIIVAMAKNNVIGKNGDLPWRLSADLKHFANVTKDHDVIMGRKTYESIVKRLGHGLPNRKNIIITNQENYQAPDCLILKSIDEVVKMSANKDEEVFVIGGGEIYKQMLPFADKLYITEVSTDCDGDAFFPTINKEDWNLISSEPHQKDDKNSCDFTFTELIKK